MTVRNFIANQFRKPGGLAGKIISNIMKKGNRSAYERLISIMDIKKNDELLEIGYGHGLGLQMICNRIDCNITGIDFSQLMFSEASRRNSKQIINKRISLYYGDYNSHVFVPDSFDKVFFINVIYFWTDLEVPFRKIYDELKIDGKLFIYMAHKDDLNKLSFTSDNVFSKYSIDFVEEKLQVTGFKDINYQYDRGFYITAKK